MTNADHREEESDGTIEEELQKADVILLLYEVMQPETMQRVATYWMPRISRFTQCPVVFVGTKADLRPANVQPADEFEENMRSLVRDSKQCEVMIECSARSLLNISDLFYCAQRLVLYPTAPLFNSVSRELTPAFIRALKFIFRRFDEDNNQLLSLRELMLLDLQVFHNEIPEVDADKVMDLVQRECPEGVTEEGMNFHGFQHLMKLMILRLKMQFCWAMLRHFGFSDSLTLDVNCELGKPPGTNVRLTHQALHFLQEVFEQSSQDGVMTYENVREVFGACAGPPWAPQRKDEQAWLSIDKYVRTTGDLGISLTSWLALWWLLVWTDYDNAYKYLWYIGLQLDTGSAFYVTHEKTPCVYVLGASGTGKTCFLESFLQKPFKDEQHPTSSVRSVCDVVEEGTEIWKHQFLIVIPKQLKEVPQVELEALLKAPQTESECSLVCLLADGSPASITFLKNPLLTYFRSDINKIVVRTKRDERIQAEFPCDLEIEVKRTRPTSLFQDLLRLSWQQAVEPRGRELMHSVAAWGLLIAGALALMWVIRRKGLLGS